MQPKPFLTQAVGSVFGGTSKRLEAATGERPTLEAGCGEAALGWHQSGALIQNIRFPLGVGSPGVRQDRYQGPGSPADTS